MGDSILGDGDTFGDGNFRDTVLSRSPSQSVLLSGSLTKQRMLYRGCFPVPAPTRGEASGALDVMWAGPSRTHFFSPMILGVSGGPQIYRGSPTNFR
jgi:hypothetical protein